MITKGKFFWEKTWYSFCSMHSEHDENCNACKSGTWENNWMHSIGSLIYKKNTNLWRWWVNRKYKKHKK